MTLHDDTIDVPAITAGTHRVAFTNNGAVPREAAIVGVPSDTDLSRAAAELETWMEGGQPSPSPIVFDLPGGQQSIPPGETVLLTLHFEAGYSYQIEDFSDDEPINIPIVVP